MSGLLLILSMLGVGLSAGVIGGLFGIGGGLVIVPALMLLFNLDQKTATGTSLMAQLLPVAVLAVWKYDQQGQVRFSYGLWIAAGLVFGTLLGAMLSTYLKPGEMKRIYGVFLIVVGCYFLLNKSKPSDTPAPTLETKAS